MKSSLQLGCNGCIHLDAECNPGAPCFQLSNQNCFALNGGGKSTLLHALWTFIWFILSTSKMHMSVARNTEPSVHAHPKNEIILNVQLLHDPSTPVVSLHGVDCVQLCYEEWTCLPLSRTDGGLSSTLKSRHAHPTEARPEQTRTTTPNQPKVAGDIVCISLITRSCGVMRRS